MDWFSWEIFETENPYVSWGKAMVVKIFPSTNPVINLAWADTTAPLKMELPFGRDVPKSPGDVSNQVWVVAGNTIG